MRVKMVVAYDGTNYSGWQIQPNGVTIEQKLNEALQALLGEDPRDRRKPHGRGGTFSGKRLYFFLIRIPVCRRRRSATH